MEVKVVFSSSRPIHPKVGILSTSKYRIEPIPDTSKEPVRSPKRYMLRFDDEIRQGEKASQPDAEARLFLSLFSVIIGSRISIEGSMINNVPLTPATKVTYTNYETVVEDLPALDQAISDLSATTEEVARQYLRSCDVYRNALSLIGENNTLSFFLLTIAIECIANKVVQHGGTCDRFIEFVFTYLPNKTDFESEEEWRGILKEIYYRHRSGFTHGGKDVPEAAWLADKLNRRYVKNEIDGKEVKTPGLKWFEGVVRDCLHEFLARKDFPTDQPVDYLKEFSLEHGRVKVKAKRDLKQGEVIFEKDIELD